MYTVAPGAITGELESMSEIAKAVGTAERLVMAGVEIARDQGLPALTARALADRAGTSPSALNYHLGGREALIERVLQEARAAAANWRMQQLADIRDEGGGAPAWISPASILAAMIGDRVTTFRTWSLLLAEFEFEADAGNIPALAPAVGDEVAATAKFWADAALALGESPEHAAVWSDLAIGLDMLMLGDEPIAEKAPWIIDALGRLHARLRGLAAPSLLERPLGAAERLSGVAPSSESAQKLVDAALQIIGEKGADRLTQREVAAAAGLSLAATTYFFRTKADLVAAAFHELHRQVSAQALATSESGRMLFSGTLEEGGDRASWRVRAMEALQLVSARDVSIAPIAQELRLTRGATSIVWLRNQGLVVDRLDAFVFSTAMSGVVQRTRFTGAGARRLALGEGQARLLRAMFKV